MLINHGRKTMTKQSLKQRSALRDHVGRIKEKLNLTNQIRESEKAELTFYMRFRYLGLALVQGSSILILLGMALMPYFITLWFGLLVYQITAYRFWFQDRKVYRLTKETCVIITKYALINCCLHISCSNIKSFIN